MRSNGFLAEVEDQAVVCVGKVVIIRVGVVVDDVLLLLEDCKKARWPPGRDFHTLLTAKSKILSSTVNSLAVLGVWMVMVVVHCLLHDSRWEIVLII